MENEVVKIAVLEQKFADFVNAVNKIEDAIVKLIEANVNVSKMLAVHEERIEQAVKSDELIVRMIDTIKLQNTTEHLVVIKRLENVEKSISDLNKFKWQTLALTGFSVILVGLTVPFIDNMIQSNYTGSSDRIEIKQ